MSSRGVGPENDIWEVRMMVERLARRVSELEKRVEKVDPTPLANDDANLADMRKDKERSR